MRTGAGRNDTPEFVSENVEIFRRRTSRESELLVEESEHVNDSEIGNITVEMSESVGVELESFGESREGRKFRSWRWRSRRRGLRGEDEVEDAVSNDFVGQFPRIHRELINLLLES